MRVPLIRIHAVENGERARPGRSGGRPARHTAARNDIPNGDDSTRVSRTARVPSATPGAGVPPIQLHGYGKG